MLVISAISFEGDALEAGGEGRGREKGVERRGGGGGGGTAIYKPYIKLVGMNSLSLYHHKFFFVFSLIFIKNQRKGSIKLWRQSQHQ